MVTGKKQLGSQALATAMVEGGIETIFTLAGGHFLPTYEAIGKQGRIEIVAARHELGAGYMASGYALATGTPGVVFSGAPGPGATNLVTPVANAQADSIPMLVLTAQVDRRYLNRNILQYADNVGIFNQFCKSSVQAVSATELPNLIATSLQIATSGRQGPVHIDLPQSLQAESINVLESLSKAQFPINEPSGVALSSLFNLIEKSDRPAILAGHGVIRGRGTRALGECAKILGAPVATSRSGIGSINSADENSVGMLGFYGTDTAKEAIRQADLVLVIGCALGEQTTFGWQTDLFAPDVTIVHVDVDPKQANLVYPISVAFQCCAGAFLERLKGFSKKKKRWYRKKPHPIAAANRPDNGLSAADVLQMLNFHLDDQMLVSGDIGNHRLWMCDQLRITCPERLMQSCEFDAMGFSLPAAVGAAVANPQRRVVSISGDGGFVHTLGEMAVIKAMALPVIIIVFVDGALGILRHQAEAIWGNDRYVRLEPIDFTTVANGFGIEARKIENTDDLKDAMAWAFKKEGPCLLSVVIDPAEVFPPLKSKIEQRKKDLMTKI